MLTSDASGGCELPDWCSPPFDATLGMKPPTVLRFTIPMSTDAASSRASYLERYPGRCCDPSQGRDLTVTAVESRGAPEHQGGEDRVPREGHVRPVVVERVVREHLVGSQ